MSYEDVTIDLSEHGIHPARSKDPAVVLVLHEDTYAVKLWRRVVAAFADVTMVESIEEAPKRISLAVMPEGPKEPQPTPGVAVIESGRHARRRDLGRQGLDRPSAFEAAEALRVRLEDVHERSFAHDLPNIDERPSVLIIEDELPLLRSMARHLGKFRPYLRLRGTGSAEEAIDILSRENFDLVFADSFLPAPGGLAVLDRIRARSDHGVSDLMIKRGTNCSEFDFAPYAPFAVFNEPYSIAALRGRFGAALARRGYDPTVVGDLKARSGPRVEAAEGAEDCVIPPRRPHVLVVNDEVLATRGIARGLRRSFPEVHVTCAHGGAEAFVRLSERIVDLVILDDVMPEPDGHDVIRAMRRVQKTGRTPVVFASAFGDGRAPPGEPLARMRIPAVPSKIAHVVACALAERGFDLPAPAGGWPALDGSVGIQYFDPAFRERLLATAGAG
ncbi:MAG: response regulator [Deltaproteobacteria bacterium]